MLRFADFYADRRQTTDKPIALPPAAHARTRGNNVRPDQLNKLLHGFARSNFLANKRKKIKLGGAYVQLSVSGFCILS